MEGEENELTTFSTWTIMLGCNESNIIFQQHICKLGQLRRSNGRNSQVFGQAMKKRPTGHYKKYSHFKGRDTVPAAGWGAVSLIHQLQEREHCCSRIRACATHAQFYHVTVWWMTKYFVRHCQSIYMYNLWGHTVAGSGKWCVFVTLLRDMFAFQLSLIDLTLRCVS